MALTTAQIQNAYVAFFNRPADVAGLTYWSTYAGSTADLLNTFAQSTEYKNLYSGLNNTQIVNTVYSNLFGHTPDVAGLTYWVTQLDQGKLAIGNIADAINKGAQGTDATIIANKTTAATEFTKALDTTAEIVAYAGVNSTGLDAVKAWLAAVTSDSATLTNAISTATLTSITTTVLNNVGGGSTFTLTTAADNVTGTNGNDTIQGDFTATATLNVTDQINGGAGTDTLKLFGTYDSTKMPASITNVEVLDLVVAADAALDLSAFTKATTGISKVVVENAAALNSETITTTAGQALSLSTGASGLKTAGTVTWSASTTDTSLDLTLNGYQGLDTDANATALTISDAAAATTLNIASTTAANKVSTLTVGAQTNKVVLTGDKALRIADISGANLKTVDASATSGGVYVGVDSANATTTFTGGSGNDTVVFGSTNTFTTADVIDGGAGTDTIGMNRAQAANVSSSTTIYSNIKNVEKLLVTDATTNGDFYDLKAFGVSDIEFGAAASATTTVRNINSGANLTLGTASGVVLSIGSDTSADTLNLAVKGAGVTYTVDASQFEALTINTSAATGTSTFALTDPQLSSLTLSNKTAAGTFNDQAVVLGTLGVVTSKVDLSGFSAATAANGVTVTLNSSAVNGATITGSGNNDTITGSSQGDTINGGAGVDVIDGGNGVDSITTGAGADTVKLGTTAASRDVITDFTVGTGGDIISFADSKANNTAHGTSAASAGDIVSVVSSGNLTGSASQFIFKIQVENASTFSTDGASVLNALVSGAASGTITAANAADILYFLVSDGSNTAVYRGYASAVTANAAITQDEISLIGTLTGADLTKVVAANMTFAA